jgi:hypothetical protein
LIPQFAAAVAVAIFMTVWRFMKLKESEARATQSLSRRVASYAV